MDRKQYYAHSCEGDPDARNWQKLEEHLLNVAELAGDLCSRFATAEWGYLAGLWHDLGKYRREFQEMLVGGSGGVEHSGAGAAFASLRRRGRTQSLLGGRMRALPPGV